MSKGDIVHKYLPYYHSFKLKSVQALLKKINQIKQLAETPVQLMNHVCLTIQNED